MRASDGQHAGPTCPGKLDRTVRTHRYIAWPPVVSTLDTFERAIDAAGAGLRTGAAQRRD